MKALRRFLFRLSSFARIQSDEHRLRLEVEHHIDLQTSENIQAGLTPTEARRQAVLKFGPIEAVKEQYRDQKGIPFFETLLADLRQAIRSLRNQPAFTVVALAALALGIGTNTGIFSVVNKVLLQPLPYPDPDRLVQLGRHFPSLDSFGNSVVEYMHLRQNNVFSAMALYNDDGPGFNLSGGNQPQLVIGSTVSRDYFKVFGIAPLLGRTFTEAEDLPNGPKAALISQSLWQTRFGSDPDILNRTVIVNATATPIIGVIPAAPGTEIWLPLQADPDSANPAHYLSVAARLKPGVTLAQAQAEMRILADRFRHLYPKFIDKEESVAVTPLRDVLVSDMRKALYILLAAVALVLLIACANVASLLLARSAARQRELAIRAAIGASRWRIVRQLLTESVLLSVVGGILGSLLGVIGVRGLLLLVPVDIPRLDDPSQLTSFFALVDWRILAFTIAVSLFTGVLFGLFPAMQISNPNLATTLKEAATRSATSRRQNFTRKTLVACEMALALVLLTSAALLIRTFISLSNADAGIHPDHILTLRTSLVGASYQATQPLNLFTRQALQRIESTPGVIAAATATVLPTTSNIDMAFYAQGKTVNAGQDDNGDEQWRSVSPHYFAVFQIPLLRGRLFDQRDTFSSARVIVINNALARKYFPNQDPIGKTIQIGKGAGPDIEDNPRQIIGVVADVREAGLDQGKVPVNYIPQTQQPDGVTRLISGFTPLSWAVRSNLDDKALSTVLTKAIQTIDPQMPIAQVQPMESVLHNSLSRQNFNMLLLSIFAASALLLAAIGIYGLMSYSVQQQSQEIGIRMALGANPGAMFRLVLQQALPPALIGVTGGLTCAFALSRLLESLLYGVTPTDPLSFFGAPAILLLVAIIAVLIPARRAMSVDPATALRTD